MIATSAATATATIPAPHDDGFSLRISLGDGYRQTVDFGSPHIAPLLMDEPSPLGDGAGPNPVRVLGSAVGGCLAASLLFCLRKARIEVDALETTVSGTLVRNDKGRLRVGSLNVRLDLEVPEEQHDRVPRCLGLFEDFCVVTATVRQSVDVTVEVVLTPSVFPASTAPAH